MNPSYSTQTFLLETTVKFCWFFDKKKNCLSKDYRCNEDAEQRFFMSKMSYVLWKTHTHTHVQYEDNWSTIKTSTKTQNLEIST